MIAQIALDGNTITTTPRCSNYYLLYILMKIYASRRWEKDEIHSLGCTGPEEVLMNSGQWADILIKVISSY